MIYLSGPGHGGNAMVAQDWLDGTYTRGLSQHHPGRGRHAETVQAVLLPRRHAQPRGAGDPRLHQRGRRAWAIPWPTPSALWRTIPDLIAACVVGDGEAETGPLATSWHSNKFLNPITDGAVLPILHLNGFKIANPTIFSRISHEEVEQFFRGCGWEPRFVEGSEPGEDAPADGCHPGLGHPGDQAHPAARPHHGRHHPPPLAHDRVPLPQGLDRPQGGGRQPRGGLLPGPPGTHLHGP